MSYGHYKDHPSCIFCTLYIFAASTTLGVAQKPLNYRSRYTFIRKKIPNNNIHIYLCTIKIRSIKNKMRI